MSRLYTGLPKADVTVVEYCGVPEVALIRKVPDTKEPNVPKVIVEELRVCAAPSFQVNVA
jgi:hypothetical protein